MTRVDILGVGFDPVTLDDAVERALVLMERRGAYVCTPNPEMIQRCRRDPELLGAVNAADLVLPDGVGVLWAARRFGTPLPERVAGVDFASELLRRMRGSVYILGGRPGVAERAAENLVAAYPHLTVADARDGFFSDELALTAELGEKRPDLLLVCLGMEKQELWMAAHRDLPVGLMAGLGGTVDVFAGTARRAPVWWRERGLEWLYRLLREPARFRRQLSLAAYVWDVIKRKQIWHKEN